MILLPSKRKYRPNKGGGDYYAKRNGINGDHGRRGKRNKTGPKTYDKNAQTLVLRADGKLRMRKRDT